jgi:hypothetical protein
MEFVFVAAKFVIVIPVFGYDLIFAMSIDNSKFAVTTLGE